MARIRAKDTKPELLVRRMLYGAGYRFRVHYPVVPGRPDVAFPARKKLVQVHGCFWHGHEGCRAGRVPQTHEGYWAGKLASNKERDRRRLKETAALGWETLVIWECELKDTRLLARLKDYLGPPAWEREQPWGPWPTKQTNRTSPTPHCPTLG